MGFLQTNPPTEYSVLPLSVNIAHHELIMSLTIGESVYWRQIPLTTTYSLGTNIIYPKNRIKPITVSEFP